MPNSLAALGIGSILRRNFEKQQSGSEDARSLRRSRGRTLEADDACIRDLSRLGPFPAVESVGAALDRSFGQLGPDSRASSCLLFQLAKARRPDVASQLLSQLQAAGLEVNSYHYGAVIHAHATVGDWTGARDLLTAMIIMNTADVQLIEFNAAISACGKSSEWVHAAELLGMMVTQGVELITVTYSTAMSACRKGGEWAQALELPQPD